MCARVWVCLCMYVWRVFGVSKIKLEIGIDGDVPLKKSNDRKNNQIFIDCKIGFFRCAIVIQLLRLLYRFNSAFISSVRRLEATHTNEYEYE